MEPAESEPTDPGEEQAWADALLEDVDQQMGRPTLKLKVNTSTGVISSTPSTPSPMVGQKATGGKDMNKLRAAMEKVKEEERRAKADMDNHSSKIGMKKVATPSSSSGSLTTSSNDCDEPAEKIKATR